MRVEIDTEKIRKRMEEFQGNLNASIKSQIYRGAIPYTPYLTGALQTSAYSSSVDKSEFLIYNIKYARYQYYANGLAPGDFPNRNRNPHLLASCLWVNKYLNQNGKADIQAICDVAPIVLRF